MRATNSATSMSTEHGFVRFSKAVWTLYDDDGNVVKTYAVTPDDDDGLDDILEEEGDNDG